MRSARVVCGMVAVTGLALLTACGSSSDGAGEQPTTTSTAPPSTTVVTTGPASGSTSATSSTTSPAPGSTAAPSSSSTSTAPGLVPGQPCTPGSSPDCIDPFGDGQYVYLIGGGECMASPIGGSLCGDLDGDGYAGYPDSG